MLKVIYCFSSDVLGLGVKVEERALGINNK
jgi:hypothetical protein